MMTEELRPSKAEKEFLTLAYNRFYDIFEEEFNETKCIQQIDFLKNNTIQYAVISQFFISYFLNKSDFVNNILVPDFYNITLYSNGDLLVHYAPFFDSFFNSIL